MVTLCRSPTYTPDEIMPLVECEVLARLRAIFPDLDERHMEEEDAARITCGDVGSGGDHALVHAAREDPTTLKTRAAEAGFEPGTDAFTYLTTATAMLVVGAVVFLVRPRAGAAPKAKKHRLPKQLKPRRNK